MDPAVVATLVVSVCVAIGASITAPLILARQAERMRRQDREADWARQDQVAAKAAEAVGTANGKLDVIHDLVNSNLTAAMQAELDALETSAAMMREVIDLKKAAGRPPAQETIIALQAIDAKIAALKTAISNRSAP